MKKPLIDLGDRAPARAAADLLKDMREATEAVLDAHHGMIEAQRRFDECSRRLHLAQHKIVDLAITLTPDEPGAES